MEENKDLRRYDDDEIEIDLVELWHELKSNVALIAGVTAAFVAAAALYCFVIAKPVYSATVFVKLPPSASALAADYLELCKSDIENKKLWGEDPIAKLVKAEQPRGTKLIKLSYEGKSKEDASKLGAEYTNKLLNKINQQIVTLEEEKFSREVVNMIREDISDINGKLRENRIGAAETKGKLDYLLKHIEDKEKNRMFLKAEVADKPVIPDKPIRPAKAKTLGISLVAGLFLSCGWIIAKYVFRKGREGKVS